MDHNTEVKVNSKPTKSKKILWDKSKDKELAEMSDECFEDMVEQEHSEMVKQKPKKQRNTYKPEPETKSVTDNFFRFELQRIVKIVKDEMSLEIRKKSLKTLFQVI